MLRGADHTGHQHDSLFHNNEANEVNSHSLKKTVKLGQ